jgi:hypothetical protein
LAKFIGHDALDPQGKVVDTTARIMSLCDADQILCSREVKDNLLSDVVLSERYVREVKGIRDGVEVFELIVNGRKHRPPKQANHVDLATPKINGLFAQAIEAELTGKIDSAATRYESILVDDPLHFGANYRLSRLGFKYRKELKIDVANVLAFANKAEESRPESGAAKAQSVVASWAHRIPGTEVVAGEEFQDTLIEKARAAVSLARSDCDRYAELVAMNVLAWVLAEKFERTRSNEIYQEAERICRMAEHIIDDFERKLLPAFYDTYARVLIFDKLNRHALLKAKELADKSMQLWETPYVHKTLALVVELLEGE